MKTTLILVYTVLIGTFGFFYDDGSQMLKATNEYNDMTNFYDVDMPSYPNVEEYPISNSSYVNNSRTQSSYFYTTDSPLTVGDYFANYWESQGFKTFSNLNPEGGSVSVYDYKSGYVKSVSINAEGKNYLVTLNAMKPNNYTREFNTFSDIPVNKDSYGFMSYESEDSYYKASSVSYINPNPIKDNVDFYMKSFPKTGWSFKKEVTLEKINFSKTLVFEKGDKVAELNVTDMQKSGTSIYLVIRDKNTGLMFNKAGE